ncbi:MAG: hypothetical protein M3N19_02845 [Candidatus Eremiobacteraeota bacterium]|nr:hypothetical protein [Candidatus Eremiobacteraeota bacterium]
MKIFPPDERVVVRATLHAVMQKLQEALKLSKLNEQRAALHESQDRTSKRG